MRDGLCLNNFPVLIEGEERGGGVVAPMTLLLDEEVPYSFDVIFEESVVRRLMFRSKSARRNRNQLQPRSGGRNTAWGGAKGGTPGTKSNEIEP